VALEKSGALPPSISCGSCGQTYGVRKDTGTPRDRHREAVVVAKATGIDLASATSVVLGIFTAEQALGMAAKKPTPAARLPRREASPVPVRATPEPTPSAAPEESAPVPSASAAAAKQIVETSRGTGSVLPWVVDADYGRALANGSMTEHDAAQRGERRVVAAGLMKRHGLTSELALKVVDREISLRAALLELADKAEPDPEEVRKRSVSAWQVVVTCLVAVAVVATIGWTVKSRVDSSSEATRIALTPVKIESDAPPAEPSVEPPPLVSPVESETDVDGALVRVVAPSPRRALLAFCGEGESAERREPLAVLRTVPPFPGRRLGVFRDYGSLTRLLAIEINRDVRTGRWIVGGGEGPIEIVDVPASFDPTTDATLLAP
jgi:hypothetical protein